jgi:hypothetical protein
MLEESIAYSRSALKVKNFGVARLNLAAVLYVKAAILQKEGKDNGELLREADALGVSEERVLEWFMRNKPAIRAYAPDVLRLFESRVSRQPVPARVSPSPATERI